MRLGLVCQQSWSANLDGLNKSIAPLLLSLAGGPPDSPSPGGQAVNRQWIGPILVDYTLPPFPVYCLLLKLYRALPMV